MSPYQGKEIFEFVKIQKAWSIKNIEHGTVPPTVLVEKDDHVCAIVIAPQIDKELGLHAANLCKAGFDPDFLTVLFDANIVTQKIQEGQSIEEAEKAVKEKLKSSDLGMEEKFASDLGFSDCIICCRIGRDLKVDTTIYPYRYDEKTSVFEWVEVEGDNRLIENLKDTSGYIPTSLKDIMSQKPFFEQHPDALETAKNFGFSDERAKFHIARTFMGLLVSEDFSISDQYSAKHVEWIDAKPKAIKYIDAMLKEKIISKDAVEPCIAIINEEMGKTSFTEKMAQLFIDNPTWITLEVLEDIHNFVGYWESAAMSPEIPDPKDVEKQIEKQKKKNKWKQNKSMKWN